MIGKRDRCEEVVVVEVEDQEDVVVDEVGVVDTLVAMKMREATKEHIVDSQGDPLVALKTKRSMLMENKSRKVGKRPDQQGEDVPETVTQNADPPRKERLRKEAKLLKKWNPNQRLPTEK